ncbi:hypothetical protein GCM10028778_20730 [Barrientosiimonas marina]
MLAQEGIPLTVLPGQESRIHGEMADRLLTGDIMPLNQTTSYVFVELPSGHVPRYSKQLFFDLQVQGYIPVIVHPERNRELMERPDELQDLVKHGALSQVTAACLSGHFGKKRQKYANQLINANLSHFIASDAHNTTSRGFCLQEAYAVLDKEHGADVAAAFSEIASCWWPAKRLTACRLSPSRKSHFSVCLNKMSGSMPQHDQPGTITPMQGRSFAQRHAC